FSRDWSSDVCSSDLPQLPPAGGAHLQPQAAGPVGLDARLLPAPRLRVDPGDEPAPPGVHRGGPPAGRGRPPAPRLLNRTGAPRRPDTVGRTPRGAAHRACRGGKSPSHGKSAV